MLDYRTLPFISSQSPYLESLRPDRQRHAEGVSGRDVEFVVYGWSRAPIYASGHQRLDAAGRGVSSGWSSRASRSGPTLERGGRTFRVYFLSDRGGIYALGYPVITLVRPPDQPRGAGVLAGVALRRAARRRDALQRADARARRRAAARCCARCDRASTASCSSRSSPSRSSRSSSWRSRRGPTSPTQLRAGVEEAAAQDGDGRAAAGRGLRDAAAARRRGARRRSTIRSWCSSGARSTRTSTCSTARGCRRPASAICSRRGCCRRARPATSIARIVLDRLPTYVGERGRRRLPLPARRRAGPRRRPRGDRDRAADRCAARRSSEQIDELDRRVLSASVLFVPARRRARVLDGRTDRRSGEPADARDAAHRARRSRRADRRDLVRRAAAAGRGLQPDGRRPEAAARASSNARSGSRRGPTWRARSRTTSRTR